MPGKQWHFVILAQSGKVQLKQLVLSFDLLKLQNITKQFNWLNMHLHVTDVCFHCCIIGSVDHWSIPTYANWNKTENLFSTSRNHRGQLVVQQITEHSWFGLILSHGLDHFSDQQKIKIKKIKKLGKCNFAFHLLLKAPFKYLHNTAKTTSLYILM